MTEAQRLIQLIDALLAAAKGATYAHPIKCADLKALRKLLLATVEST